MTIKVIQAEEGAGKRGIGNLSKSALDNTDDSLQLIFHRKHWIQPLELGEVKKEKWKDL